MGDGKFIALDITDEEYELLRSLAERWATELEESLKTIDENIPLHMRPSYRVLLQKSLSEINILRAKLV